MAAPCPVDIKKQMLDWWGPIVDEYYSSSEGAGITFISADDWVKHPGSVGKPLFGVAHIVDERERCAGQARPDIRRQGSDGVVYRDPEAIVGSVTSTAG